MEKFSAKSVFEKQFDKLWNDAISNGISMADRGYSAQDEINFDSLLFVGCNPSYDGISHVDKSENKVGVFYKNADVINRRPILRYFTKFPILADAANLNWHHIDLFFVRETNQDIFKSLFDKGEMEKTFLFQQRKISTEIIERSKPKIIVVVNAHAAEIFRHIFPLEFDNKIGTYRVKGHQSLENTPVFLSGMLTGQRALDNGSFDRLKWHIQFVLEKMNN